MNQSYDCRFSKVAKLVAMLVCLALAGCQPHRAISIDDANKLPTHVDGAYDPTIIALQTRLSTQGVRVITIGQDYLVSIPSVLLFATESPKLKWPSYRLLNDVVCYLQQFRKININVHAFSNKCVSPQREHALTHERARVVANYLWSQGIDSRFIFTQGLGSDKPIVATTQRGDDSPNSRIEITFRRAVA